MSPQQQSANRENAKHSTGPRTPEGKQTSSQNALAHGAYSDRVLLPTEDRAAHLKLFLEIIDKYNPQTPSECDLAATIHQSEWRLRRALRIERNTFVLVMGEQFAILQESFQSQGQLIDSVSIAELAEAAAFRVEARLFAHLRREEKYFRKLIVDATKQLLAEIQARQAKAAEAQSETAEPPQEWVRSASASASASGYAYDPTPPPANS